MTAEAGSAAYPTASVLLQAGAAFDCHRAWQNACFSMRMHTQREEREREREREDDTGSSCFGSYMFHASSVECTEMLNLKPVFIHSQVSLSPSFMRRSWGAWWRLKSPFGF